MSKKRVAIKDFVTDEMFEEIKGIGPDAKRIAAEVIAPRIGAINRKLGQENDPAYLAYAVVHALNQCMGGAK